MVAANLYSTHMPSMYHGNNTTAMHHAQSAHHSLNPEQVATNQSYMIASADRAHAGRT